MSKSYTESKHSRSFNILEMASFKNPYSRGQREGSMSKSTHCSPGFDSQHPHDWWFTKSSLTPSQGVQFPLLTSVGTRHIHVDKNTQRQNTHPHKTNIKTNNKISILSAINILIIESSIMALLSTDEMTRLNKLTYSYITRPGVCKGFPS